MDKASLAPGQHLGYSLQPTRLLMRLLDASPGDMLSVECLDDVGHERADGSVEAEQDKSVTGEGNPVADRAVSLWKTLANWIGLVEQAELALGKTTFVIYVSQPKSGSVVSSFNEARDESQALAALSAARKILRGDAPKYPLRPNTSKILARHVDRVFTADLATVAGIIARFSLVQGSGSPQEDLSASFQRRGVILGVGSNGCLMPLGFHSMRECPLLLLQTLAQDFPAAACSLSPSALMTFITVANSGFPSTESAL